MTDLLLILLIIGWGVVFWAYAQSPVVRPVERLVYRISRINEAADQLLARLPDVELLLVGRGAEVPR